MLHCYTHFAILATGRSARDTSTAINGFGGLSGFAGTVMFFLSVEAWLVYSKMILVGPKCSSRLFRDGIIKRLLYFRINENR